MADLLGYIALFCLPAPFVAVALVALVRRLTWRRALLGSLLAQWIIVLAIAARVQIGLRGCWRSDAACLRSLSTPVGAHELMRFRLQLLLVLGIGGTLSALAVGALATWVVRRVWPPSIDRALS
jgi:hypothetical protein